MPSHDTLAAEAAAFLEVLAGRLQRYAVTAPDSSHDAQRCTGCPICVALTYVDEHRDVGVQIAQGLLTVVTALRQHIPAGDAADSPAPADAAAAGSAAAPDSAGHVAGGSGSGTEATQSLAVGQGAGSGTAGGSVQRIDIR